MLKKIVYWIIDTIMELRGEVSIRQLDAEYKRLTLIQKCLTLMLEERNNENSRID